MSTNFSHYFKERNNFDNSFKLLFLLTILIISLQINIFSTFVQRLFQQKTNVLFKYNTRFILFKNNSFWGEERKKREEKQRRRKNAREEEEQSASLECMYFSRRPSLCVSSDARTSRDTRSVMWYQRRETSPVPRRSESRSRLRTTAVSHCHNILISSVSIRFCPWRQTWIIYEAIDRPMLVARSAYDGGSNERAIKMILQYFYLREISAMQIDGEIANKKTWQHNSDLIESLVH